MEKENDFTADWDVMVPVDYHKAKTLRIIIFVGLSKIMNTDRKLPIVYDVCIINENSRQ